MGLMILTDANNHRIQINPEGQFLQQFGIAIIIIVMEQYVKENFWYHLAAGETI